MIWRDNLLEFRYDNHIICSIWLEIRLLQFKINPDIHRAHLDLPARVARDVVQWDRWVRGANARASETVEINQGLLAFNMGRIPSIGCYSKPCYTSRFHSSYSSYSYSSYSSPSFLFCSLAGFHLECTSNSLGATPLWPAGLPKAVK